jgi:hypothetical protein
MSVLTITFAAAMLVTGSLSLPNGYEDISWGTTIEELTSQIDVHKATPGSEYSYADHMEQNPTVYVRVTKKDTRVEYYFFEGLLYKIYVVYNRAKSSDKFYQKRIIESRKQFGPAQSHYQEKVFGLLVLHVKWDDGTSSFDLRSGAGYIYEVYVDKKAERKKAAQARQRKIQEKSI